MIPDSREEPRQTGCMLEPIEGLVFDETAHRYKYKDRWLALSPTQILSFDMRPEVKERIEETRHEWEPRGNTLHGCLEQFLLGAAELNPEPYQDWWKSLRNCWLWTDAEILGVELRMTDKVNMGGSCDFLIRKDNQVILGDLKTVGSVKACDARKPADAQLGAYLFLLSKTYPKVMVEKCVTVVSGPGKCRVITSDPVDCWLAWEDAMGKYKAHYDALGF